MGMKDNMLEVPHEYWINYSKCFVNALVQIGSTSWYSGMRREDLFLCVLLLLRLLCRTLALNLQAYTDFINLPAEGG